MRQKTKSFNVKLCASLMKLMERRPAKDDPLMRESFSSSSYVNGEERVKYDMRIKSARSLYEYENVAGQGWFEKYFFPRVTKGELINRTLLDLGCFTGGRLIHWTEAYQLGKTCGVDINPIYVQAGRDFARLRNLDNVSFFTAFGEALPFLDETFDFVVMIDVLEHVSNPQQVLHECYRVLKPSGKLLVVFPQFLQPFEAHLGSVTTFPALHWLFDNDTVTNAYFSILSERVDASWYTPKGTRGEWEVLPSLNGLSYRRFKEIIKMQDWRDCKEIIRPIFTDGCRSNLLLMRIMSFLVWPLAYLPVTRELFLGRVNMTLKK
jgi:ubiquinone/menaquinone biosynthesis C-methylase UbiE